MKQLYLHIFILIGIFLFFLSPIHYGRVWAQSCSGTITCCSSQSLVNVPSGCSWACQDGDPLCTECTGSEYSCDSWEIPQTCELTANSSSCQVPNGCGGMSDGSCSYTAPVPSGGWSCTDPENSTCTWSSSGSYSSQVTCETNCNPTATPPPTPPPITCGSEPACSGGKTCCNNSFCYNPATEGYLCSGFQSACTGTGNICGTGVGIPGSNGTGCNSEMISYRNSEGKITLAAVKTDGTNCSKVWGGRSGGNDNWGGLAVWKKIPDDQATNDHLYKPNYPDLGPGFPEIIVKDLTAILLNDDYKVSLNPTTDDPNEANTYLLNPACVTNSGYGGAGTNGTQSFYGYLFNDTTDRSNTADNVAEERWDKMRACRSDVQYVPIQCSVFSSASNVAEGENLTITLSAGSRKPVHIDGHDASSPGYTARLFLEKTDFSEIVPLPTGLTYTDGQPGNLFYYHLSSADCVFDSETGNCITTFGISDLPAGSYNFHCDIPRVPYGQNGGSFEPQNCTGNPWCSHEGGDSANVCTDWISCSVDDHLNIVVTPGLPPAPQNLVSSCTAPGDKMTLSWDPVAEADSYLIRIDSTANNSYDGDDIDAVGYPDDTCASNLDWDVCVDVSSDTTSLDIEYHPVNFESAIWRVYAANNSGIGDYTETTLQTCIPNCYDLSGPDEIIKGELGAFGATYFSGNANHFAGLLAGQYNSSTGLYESRGLDEWTPTNTSCGLAGCTETFSWDTSDVPVGTYDVFCRTYVGSSASCRGNANYITATGQYICRGPGVTTMSVEVLPPTFTISGTVYDGIGGISGSYCAAQAGDSAWDAGSGMNMTVSGLIPSPNPSGTTNVSGLDGTYSSGTIESDSGTATIAIGGIPAGYDVVCPVGGQYSINTNGITADVSGVNFFITQLKSAWWQARSGWIYGSSITANLPYNTSGELDPACTIGVGCVPFLAAGSLTDSDPNKPSAGIPISLSIIGTNDYDSEHHNGTEYYDSVSHSDASLAQERYAVLARRFDLTAATNLADTLTELPTGGNVQGSDNTEVYAKTGDLTVAPSSQWIVSGKKVLFIDGNVTIDGTGVGPFITVGTDSFFAIIATGNITFSQDIGETMSEGQVPSTATQIEGVFVADGILTVEDNDDIDAIDRVFVGAGTFVGWSGISLPRDFETEANPSTSTINSYAATDVFVFRPDFILNAPELMKRSTFTWREINSITQNY